MEGPHNEKPEWTMVGSSSRTRCKGPRGDEIRLVKVIDNMVGCNNGFGILDTEDGHPEIDK